MDQRSAPTGASAAPVPHFLPIPDIAVELGVIVTKVHQMVRDRLLISVRRDGFAVIPGEFVADGEVIRGLAGTITQLTDAGYDDEEIITWLFDTEVGPAGSAIESLRAGRVKDVHRQAQVAGF